jgi:hypothetical protein
LSRFYFCVVRTWTRTEKSCEATPGSTTSRFDKRSKAESGLVLVLLLFVWYNSAENKLNQRGKIWHSKRI